MAYKVDASGVEPEVISSSMRSCGASGPMWVTCGLFPEFAWLDFASTMVIQGLQIEHKGISNAELFVQSAYCSTFP